ncbi:condensation domain-containing protein, partial [Micromonospora sp. NPDC048843]|uniref:condensation domain-containing protein n=1 Tax=Micromonospora sp. NPDC048843 TaxID=3155389 RepID=UPI0033D13412
MASSAIEDIWPLTPLQEGLLFHALYDESAVDVYNCQLVIGVRGPLDAATLRAAMEGLLRRHAILRVAFWHEDLDRPVQVVSKRASLPWREIDLAGLVEAERATALRDALAEDRLRRFDVTTPPLVRCTLIRTGAEEHRIVITVHHLLMDGWSLPIMVAELFALYRHAGDERALEPVTSFRRFLSWLEEQDAAAGESAWRRALSGLVDPALVAPGRTHVPGTLPAQETFVVDESTVPALIEQARRIGVTLNTVVQGAWGVLLGILTDRKDVVFGTTVSVRPPEIPHIERLIGMLVNTVPVRVRWTSDDSWSTMLTRLQDERAELIPHQHLGLATIQRLAGSAELFDTAIVFENAPGGDERSLDMPDKLSVFDISGQDATHYPLGLAVVPGSTVRLRLDYRPDVIDEEQARGIGACLVRLLEHAATDLHAPIGRAELVSVAERGRLLVEFGDGGVVGGGGSVVGLFG